MNGYGEFIWKEGKKKFWFFIRKKKMALVFFFWKNYKFFCRFWKNEKQNGLRKFLKEKGKKNSVLMVKKILKIKWKKEIKIFENYEI